MNLAATNAAVAWARSSTGTTRSMSDIGRADGYGQIPLTNSAPFTGVAGTSTAASADRTRPVIGRKRSTRSATCDRCCFR